MFFEVIFLIIYLYFLKLVLSVSDNKVKKSNFND